MKALKEPNNESWGINYSLPELTEEFEKLIELAKEKIEPFSHEEISRFTYFFKVKGEVVLSEFDCCDDEDCIKKAKEAIRKEYGKGTHIEECYTDNDGDHDRIERCSVCGKPLHCYLTYCGDEMAYLEECKPWDAKFLLDEAFVIGVILDSTPSMDESISIHEINCGGEILETALQSREDFFQRIGQLAQSVIDADFE